jgi:hypothetical protein
MNANIRTIGGSIGSALMASIVTSDPGPGGLPREAGYTHGFAMLAAALVIAALAAVLIPATRRPESTLRASHQPERATQDGEPAASAS